MAPVLIPFVFALFCYYHVVPVVDLIRSRFKLKYTPSVLLAILSYTILYILLGLMVASSVKSALKSTDLYKARVIEFNEKIATELSVYGIEISQDGIRESLQSFGVLSWLTNVSGGVAGLLGNLGLVGIFMLFLLFGGAKNEQPIFDKVKIQLTRYIIAKVITSLMTGIFTGVALGFIGVDMAALFGLLAFLLNFIPNIGSLIAVLLPVPIAALQFGFGPSFVMALAIPAVIQFVFGNVLEPKLMGNTLDIHPITVLLALMYWGLVWGVVGMFLAVPIVVVLKMVFENFNSTKKFADIMAGRLT